MSDRLDQELAQRRLGEGRPEHVEHLAAVGLALLLDLQQQTLEHLALARVLGDEVPQPAHLALADAVDAPEPLLDPVRVPRQVVVDHQVSGLQVQALAGRVGGQQDLARGVVCELLRDLTAKGAAHPTVNRLDRLRPAQQGADPSREVLERVAVLGEDDQLAPLVARAGAGERVSLEDRAQLRPLAVGVGGADARGSLDQIGEVEQLCIQLLDGARRSRRVDQLVFEVFDLLGGELVVVELFYPADGLGRLRLGDHPALEHLLLAALEAPGPALQRPQDRLRARRKPALQDREREADGIAALAVELGGTVHPLSDVGRHLLVEVLLELGELVRDRLGDPLGEQRLALEREQVLLDHAAHHTRGVGGVHLLLVLALEAVAVQQREEELEVLFLAAVRGGRHQQEVTGDVAELLSELEALGLLELATEVVGAHAVGLVDDDEIPCGLREVGLQLLVARELIHARDQQRVVLEGRRAEHGVPQSRREDLESEAELQVQLVLPLVDKAAGGDDQAPLDVLAEDQLLDVEPGHDRLAGAGIVGEQEAQRGARQELAVDRAQLVGQRLDVRGRDGEHRVGQAGELDPLALGDELEVGPVSVEGPRLNLCDREPLLGVAAEDALFELPLRRLEGELDRIATMRVHGDHGDAPPRDYAR